MFEPDDGGLFADIMPSNGNGSVPTQVKRRLDVRKPPTASVQSSRDSGHSTEGSSVHSQDSVISRSAGKLGQLGQNITPEMEFGAKEDPSLSEDENDETLIEEQPLSNEDRLAVQLEAALETNSSLIMDEANDVLEGSDELDAVPELPSVAAYERRRSLLLEELHVYLIPREDWEGNRNLADKTVVDDCVSIGFVRVLPECTLSQLRRELMLQLEDNALPTKYVYVRGVGRHFTEVRSKQENQLKVRNFLPPQSQDPEIYLVEKFGSARSNNEATDYPYGGEFSDAEGDGTFSYYPPSTVPPRSINYHQLPEKLRVQEDLFRTKAFRKEAEMRREHLLNRAKMLQARANKHKAKLSQMWEDKFKDEFAKTGPLEVVCNALREELDAAHKERIQAFEIKMQPIIIRDGPSKKANYKIQAARLHYDIYALTQRLRHTTMRAEHEEQRRERKERMVRKLREEISEKKTAITTVTKGIPFNKIEVRPEDQIPQPSFHPLPSNNKPSTKIGPRKPVYHPATPSVAAGTLSAAQRQFSSAGLRQGLLPALPNGGFRGANTSKKEGGPGSPTKTLNRTQTIPTK